MSEKNKLINKIVPMMSQSAVRCGAGQGRAGQGKHGKSAWAAAVSEAKAG